MLHTFEIAEGLADILLAYIKQAGRQAGSHRIVQIVESAQREFGTGHRVVSPLGVKHKLLASIGEI